MSYFAETFWHLNRDLPLRMPTVLASLNPCITRCPSLTSFYFRFRLSVDVSAESSPEMPAYQNLPPRSSSDRFHTHSRLGQPERAVA